MRQTEFDFITLFLFFPFFFYISLIVVKYSNMVSTRSARSRNAAKTETQPEERPLATVVIKRCVSDVSAFAADDNDDDDDDFQEPLTVAKPRNQKQPMRITRSAKKRKIIDVEIKESSPSVVSEDTKDGWSCAATPESSSSSISTNDVQKEDSKDGTSTKNEADIDVMADESENELMEESDDELDFSAAPTIATTTVSPAVPLPEFGIEESQRDGDDGHSEHSDDAAAETETSSDGHSSETDSSSSEEETLASAARRRRQRMTEAQRASRVFSRRMQMVSFYLDNSRYLIFFLTCLRVCET